MTKSLDDYFADWEGHVFGFGYGTGEQHVLFALKLFLGICPIDGNYNYERLEKAVGSQQAWLLINALCHADILEYGSSPRYGWLTPQGKDLKNFTDPRTVENLCEITYKDSDYIHCYPDACNCGPGGYEKGWKCANPFWSRP